MSESKSAKSLWRDFVSFQKFFQFPDATISEDEITIGHGWGQRLLGEFTHFFKSAFIGQDIDFIEFVAFILQKGHDADAPGATWLHINFQFGG